MTKFSGQMRRHGASLRQRGYSLIELSIALAILSVVIVGALLGVQRILDNNRANNMLKQIPLTNAAITAATVSAPDLSTLNTTVAANLGAFPAAALTGTAAARIVNNDFGGYYGVLSAGAVGSTAAGQGYYILMTNIPRSMCPTIAGGIAPLARGVYVAPNQTTPTGLAFTASTATAVKDAGTTPPGELSVTNLATLCGANDRSTVVAYMARTSF